MKMTSSRPYDFMPDDHTIANMTMSLFKIT